MNNSARITNGTGRLAMIDKEIVHRQNSILFILISTFYFIHITINSFIEGIASIFPPAFLLLYLV